MSVVIGHRKNSLVAKRYDMAVSTSEVEIRSIGEDSLLREVDSIPFDPVKMALPGEERGRLRTVSIRRVEIVECAVECCVVTRVGFRHEAGQREPANRGAKERVRVDQQQPVIM